MAPGTTVYAAVELQMPEGWHTYWSNPSDSGDTGQPTRIDWTLPPFLTAGPIEWPVPTKLQEEAGVVLTLSGRATLLVPIRIASNAPAGTVGITAKVRWLECQKSCVQGSALIQANLIIDNSAPPSAISEAFSGFRKQLPLPQVFPLSFRWLDPPSVKARRFAVSFRNPEGVWDFFPEPISGGSFSSSKEGRPGSDGMIVVEKSLEMTEAKWPESIPGLVVRIGEGGKPLAAHAVAGAFNPAREGLAAMEAESGTAAPSLPMLLLFAFIGGLILNIMPCVLPVIALKILGFVRQGHEAPKRIRILGLGYGAGVLASFAILGALVIAVKLGGKNAHQGMLFQNPMFLVAMTALMVLIALNLFGVFEVSLAGGALDGASQLASREGIAGAFFNGVLATVLATPCTAPFLSVSIGFALGQDARTNPGLILLFFLTAGLGLAAPYVALCMQPRWLRFLPKPGAWMVRFKVIMGFPILATGIWLFSLAAGHYDSDGLLWLGMFLVTIGFAAWIYGEFVQRSRRRKLMGAALAAGVLAAAYLWILESELNWREPSKSAGTKLVGSKRRGKHKLDWADWSPAAVTEAQAAGRPVLVDFTADWCNTCQANTRTAIEVPPVLAMLKSIRAVSLIGDYTHEDPAIAAELAKYHRPGVPLVLVYSKDPGRPPKVLPELLTRGMVLEALEWAANPK